MSLDVSAESLWQSRVLLFDSEYSELEARFRKADQALVKSKDGAALYYDFVYESLIKPSDLVEDSLLLAELRKWQISRPDSYAPFVALSRYHQRYGNVLRGSKFRHQTTDEQFRGMRQQHQKSKNYAMKAIAINKSAIRAYETILTIESGRSKNRSSKPREEGLLLQLLCDKDYPRFSKKMGCSLPEATFAETPLFQKSGEGVINVRVLWAAYLFKNTPRWGGSYDRMHRIIEASKEYLKEDEIYYLAAIEVADRMDWLQEDDLFEEALKLGQDYLSIGEKRELPFYNHSPGIYVEMAQASKQLGSYGDCIYFGLNAAKIYSWNSKTFEDVGYCATRAQEWNLANIILRYHADTRFKVGSWALYYLGESFRNLRQFDLTYTLFKRAERADPSYTKYTEGALKWIEDKHPDKAIELDISIEEIIGQQEIDSLVMELSSKL